MPGVRIVTDSTADLGTELARRYNVPVIPFYTIFESESYRDGIDITADRLFEMVREKGCLPTTSAPSPGVYMSAFQEVLQESDELIYIGISSKFSAGVQNARMAADMLPPGRVRIIDSENLSTGIGILVIFACDLAAKGATADEIVTAVSDARPKVRTSFIIDTLDYLRMGGRCSGVQALASSLLHLRPVISVVDGGMVVSAKVRGSRKRALDHLVSEFQANVPSFVPDRVFVTQTGCPEDALHLVDSIKKVAPDTREILSTKAGSVISSHCGPGTIGIIYMTK
ncbi:MAG: DegV family protein [Firmicutes bacterium]|jgi:DegV family protein with EDD domain|nr:DegV family protein [Bacillota bacterium]